jgi:hypothetical protein
MINMETGFTHNTEIKILKIFGYTIGTLAGIGAGWFIIGATTAGLTAEAVDAAEIEMLINYPPPGA